MADCDMCGPVLQRLDVLLGFKLCPKCYMLALNRCKEIISEMIKQSKERYTMGQTYPMVQTETIQIPIKRQHGR